MTLYAFFFSRVDTPNQVSSQTADFPAEDKPFVKEKLVL